MRILNGRILSLGAFEVDGSPVYAIRAEDVIFQINFEYGL